MPELPEVETTARELGKLVSGLKITDVWTSYNSPYYHGKNQIKNPAFFRKFKKEVIGKKIVGTSRRAKNVLIHLEGNQTILIHMKMTGHILYGRYAFKKKEWVADEEGPLKDPFNGWIRLAFSLSNKKHFVLSDMRKFAKITLLKTDELRESEDLKNLGPEPLEKSFTSKIFSERISMKPNGKIKTVLMDQSLLSGVGNIYSDEALWLAKMHPETIVRNISSQNMKNLFKHVIDVLKSGINFGGDSMSDYRTPSGEKGQFQEHHNVYQRKGADCKRKSCEGIIERIVVGGRGTHFCRTCQK